MAMLSPLVRSSSVLSLGARQLTEFVDGPSSPRRLTEERVLGLTAYFRAVALLSGTVAGLPLNAYRGRSIVTTRTILDAPCPRWTPFEFWQILMSHAVSWGNAYAITLRNGLGNVVEMWPQHPSTVRVEEVTRTETNPAGVLYLVSASDGRERRYTQEGLLHLPFLAINGLTGAPPIRLAGTALSVAAGADDLSDSTFRKRGRLSGVLSTDERLLKDDASTIREDFEGRYTGPQSTGRVPVLHSGLKFTPIDMSPHDLELLRSRTYSVVEIARLFGIPPHMLGETEKSTSWGSGIEEQTLGFIKFTLLPWLKLIEQRVTRQVLPGGWETGSWRAKFNLNALERASAASRSALYHEGITDGWLLRNEVRDLEDRDPIEGGDDAIVPSNMTLISVDGSIIPLSAKGAENGNTNP
jgi:HK97 family phage portal protein